MFEKEAEEYVRKIRHDVINWDGTKPEERFYNEIKFEQAYLAGAEFGYNKAKEWHYVKDGDLPKEKGNYLVAWKRTLHVKEYGELGFDVDLFNADEGYFEGVGDFVIAWKEIVPPDIKE